jgi:hypothetical protein
MHLPTKLEFFVENSEKTIKWYRAVENSEHSTALIFDCCDVCLSKSSLSTNRDSKLRISTTSALESNKSTIECKSSGPARVANTFSTSSEFALDAIACFNLGPKERKRNIEERER